MTELSFSSAADLIAAVSLVSMGSTVLRAWMVCLPWAEYGRGLTEAPRRCSGMLDVRSGAAPPGGGVAADGAPGAAAAPPTGCVMAARVGGTVGRRRPLVS